MSHPRTRWRPALLAVAALAIVGADCGKKGPPLPPLVLLPAPPTGVSALRRGPRVEVTFTVPAANTDGTTPADLERVEVYAWTVPGPATGDEIVRRGERVASLPVNEPQDPDAPEPPPDEPSRKVEGAVEQGAVATIREQLTADASGATSSRAYVVVGVNSRGRRGALSGRIAVPLVDPPSAPARPRLTYDEQAITVEWDRVPAPDDSAAFVYSVYRADGTALTTAPVSETQVVDKTIAWEQERCYDVRSILVVEAARIESAASPEACVTPTDTFAPARPEGLVSVASAGAISLIWTANKEADLAGYLVLRAIEPSTELVALGDAPTTETNLRDVVPAGSRVTYAVQAVDRAGNKSEPSERIVETAR